MRKPTLLIPAAMIAFAAFPVVAQEVPRVLFCQGQCFGVAQNGDRIPVTKGTELAPGLRLETGPNSYAQVRFGPDNACGIGENARVRFESRGGERDVVILDQGRIRMVGGELIGRPVTKPVELRTSEGTIVLRSADIEVKALPKSAHAVATLIKLNIGDARIGELPVSKDAVLGIVSGKVLDRQIPIVDIATRPPRDAAPAGAREPVASLPVIGLPVLETKISTPLPVSPAIAGLDPRLSTTTTVDKASGLDLVAKSPIGFPTRLVPTVTKEPVVSGAALFMAAPLETTVGKMTFNSFAQATKEAQATSVSSGTSAPPPLKIEVISAPTVAVKKEVATTPVLSVPQIKTLTRSP